MVQNTNPYNMTKNVGVGIVNAKNALDAIGDNPPVAEFSGSPTNGVVPLTVDFTDLSSGDPTSWYWEFGDGESSYERNPTHTYDTVGKYTVSLTATNALSFY